MGTFSIHVSAMGAVVDHRCWGDATDEDGAATQEVHNDPSRWLHHHIGEVTEALLHGAIPVGPGAVIKVEWAHDWAARKPA